MIVEQNFLNKLKDFGLNSYESKLWVALLSRGVATAGELSDIANVPRSRSYDVLESLEKKGFIIVKLGKPIKYIAVPPEEVVERVKKQVREEADQKQDMLDELQSSDVLGELKTLHTQGVEMVESSDLSGSLKGRKSIYNQIETMVKNAEESVVLMTTEEGFIRKAERFKDLFAKVKDRGVSIRIAAPVSSEEAVEAAESLKDVAEIKHTPDIKSRFCVVDGKEVTFMLLDDKEVHPTYDTGVWISTDFFAKTLHDMFEKEWERLPSIVQ